MKSKLISSILIIVMLISLFPPIILAVDTTTKTYQDFEYTINDENEITITKYTGYDENVTVPSVIDGKSVCRIGEEAFLENRNLISIKILNGVILIGKSAFEKCTNLKNIEIPDSVTSIGNFAFEDCTSLINITIPNNLSSIGQYEFCRCKSLTSITIPNSVDKIEKNAFDECTSLENIEIPNSVTSIGEFAFYSCTNLTDIKIPNSVKKISQCTFGRCTSLKSITIPNCVSLLEKSAFTKCTSLESIEIPNSVIRIEDHAFESCTCLRNITMSNRVSVINERTFQSCESLESIEIPNSVTSIGTCAFSGCTSLKNIEIPDSVTSIEACAFSGCTSLKNIEIPNSLTVITRSFSNCYGLESIKIPNSVKGIGPEAFFDCRNLKNVEIPDSVTGIGKYAFWGCTSLENIEIPDSVTGIDGHAFSGCTSLKNVKVSNGVHGITEETFLNCISLTSILLPSSVTKISTNVFNGCDKNKLTLYVEKDSYAETYAKENDLKYEYIGEYVDPWKFEREGSFKCVDQTFSGEYGYKYKDSYFKETATKYNEHLATMSACLAYSAYNATTDKKYEDEDANVRNLLWQCGFNNYQAYSYDRKPSTESIACAIASKKIEDTTLIAIAVRGGGYEAEWANNFKVEEKGNHKGFQDSADKVFSNFKAYVGNNGISGKIKVWITGFSRAAAVSNLVAAKFDELATENLEYTNEDIYAYCFATPSGAISSNEPTDSKYDNIFNIIHYNDPVPLVAPSFWGFGKYGKTIYFPHGNTKKANKYKNAMKKRFNEITDGKKEYKDTVNFKFAVYNFLSTLTPIIPNIYTSYKISNIGDYIRNAIGGLNTHEALGTRKSYVSSVQEDLMNTIAGKYDQLTYEFFSNKEQLLKSIGGLLKDVLHDGIDLIDLDLLLNNLDVIVIAHAEPVYYLSWLQSMDSNYGGTEPYFEDNSQSGREVVLKTIANINIYDSNNNLVASTRKQSKNNVSASTIKRNVSLKSLVSTEDGDTIDEDSGISINRSNDQIIINLPIDEKYIIKISSDEDTDLSYMVREYYGVTADTTKVINYQNINIGKDEEIVGTIGEYTEEEIENEVNGSSAEYTLTKEDVEINSDISVSGNIDEQQSYQVSVTCDSEKGKISGTGTYKLGSYCQLIAQNNAGYEFDGWYINGNKVSSEYFYDFYVLEDSNMEARYKACEHKEKVDSITKATLNKDGEISKICTTCGGEVEKNIINYPKNIELSNTSFTYNGEIQKPTVTLKDIDGNEIDISNYDVKYSSESKDAGEYKVTVTFKGDYYEGSKELSYKINKANYDMSKTKLTDLTITYDGNVHSLNVEALPKGVIATYTNNEKIDVGTYSVIAKFIGDTTNYNAITENITATLKITSKSIENANIIGINDKTYTGKALKQSVVVKDGNTTLKNGTDYTVTYKNNKKVGTATVVITGKGNYSGTVTKTFKINPKGTSLKKLIKGKKQFKATWKAQKTQTTGYQIQYSTNKKFKSGNKNVKIKKNKTTSSTVKKLKAKKKYYVRIRTYKTVNGKTYYSRWSKVKNVTTKK